MRKKILAGILAVVMSVTMMPGSLMEKTGMRIEAEAAATLKNPRIESKSSMQAGQKVTYDCVWFGSYPQTEIVDQSGTCGTYGQAWGKSTDYEENSSLYSSLKSASGWDSNGDVTISGTKYRRIRQADATQYTSSNIYYSWNNSTSYHYFRYEPIKWKVLKVDGTRLLLLSEKALDDKPYYPENTDTTWKTSTIRSWLNGYSSSMNSYGTDYSSKNFINSAFSSTERSSIISTYLDNKTTGPYSTGSAENTTDKVFLLATNDLYSTSTAISYGFCASSDTYDEARRGISTTYGKAMGIKADNNSKYLGNCGWWLRSPGSSAYLVAYGHYLGNLPTSGTNVNHSTMGVVPAIYIDASSSGLTYAGTVCTDGTMSETSGESVIPATYTVTYDANGGTDAPVNQTKTEGVSLSISTTVPTREGYTFVGWGTSSTSTSVSYQSGSTYSKNADITLYAIWRKTIILTYDTNGGSGGPSSQTGVVYNSTTNYNFTIDSTIPSKEGYIFLGWSTKSNDITASYSGEDTISLSTDTTLYAVWQKEQLTYTVTYNANGGSGAPASQEKIEGIDLTLSSAVPSKSGYYFVGWGTSSSDIFAIYLQGGKYTKDESITLYAIWAKDVALSYDTNGGNPHPGTQGGSIYNNNTTHTFTVTDIIPSKDGYSFLGWSTDEKATTASYIAGDPISISIDTTLYAVWQKIPSSDYIISYYMNGGEGGPSFQTKKAGSSITLSTATPTKNGYEFVGWTTVNNSTQISYNPGDTYSKDEDITLYAIWKKTLTISYNANGGAEGPASQSATVYNNTSHYVFTITSIIPYRTGYTFEGWNIDRNSDIGYYNRGDEIIISSDTMLFAIWKKADGENESGGDSEVPQPISKKSQNIIAVNKTIAINSIPVSLGAKTSGNGKLSYSSSNKSVANISSSGVITPKNYGTTAITIKAAETATYKSVSKKITVTVVPKKMTLTTAKSPAKKTLLLKWKKESVATKYEIQLCMKSDFKKNTLSRTYGKKVVKQTIKNMKSKTWYVRIRAWKKVGGKTYYGVWSTVKKVKVK